MNDFKSVRKLGYVGFAYLYLEFNSDHEIDEEIYTKLVELDKRLGTCLATAFEQLYWCLNRTTRSDIIKVASFV